jgi:2-polyprenyl-3-methyl-5-hydroxy-6-metoxy-1,4-benzoquinol methylase
MADPLAGTRDARARECPVCEASTFEPAQHGLHRCGSCGALLNPLVWKSGADAELEAEWFDGGAYDAASSKWVELFERWNAERTYNRLRKAGLRTGRVLEVGIGSGATLDFLRQKGFDVEGCDMSATVCAAARKKYGFLVHHSTLDQVDPAQPFDAIVLNHVVEHVSDPVPFLEQARALLRPGGFVHIAVPNVTSWDASLSGWTSYQPYHLVYYGPATISRVIRRAGLDILAVASHEPFSGWFLAMLRSAINRGRAGAPIVAGTVPRKRSTIIEAGYRISMLLTGAVTYPLRLYQGSRLAGEELVAVAARPSE